MATVSAAVTEEMCKELDEIAVQNLVKRSVVIRWAIDDYLRRRSPRFFAPESLAHGTIVPHSDQPVEPVPPTR